MLVFRYYEQSRCFPVSVALKCDQVPKFWSMEWQQNCQFQLPRSIIHGQWGGYYGLNVRIPLKFMLRSEHAKVIVLEEGAFGRHWNHGGGAFMNGISALIKELQRDSLPHPSREDTVRRHCYELRRGPHWKAAVLGPRSQTSSLQNYEK